MNRCRMLSDITSCLDKIKTFKNPKSLKTLSEKTWLVAAVVFDAW